MMGVVFGFAFVILVVVVILSLTFVEGSAINKALRYEDEDSHNIPNITSPLRVNRIIKAKYYAGDYEVVNEQLHHYVFEIDGDKLLIGIVGVLSAIDAIDE